jgi:DNA-binding transcriptional LysR family regulator
MIINNINLNSLQVFEAVYRHGNMTLASKELALTQSGVSQHIASLEEGIGVKLFDRINKKIFPTKDAEVFYEKCKDTLFDLEHTLGGLTSNKRTFTGRVNIGIPIEFGNNLVLPLLANIRQTMPGIEYKIYYGHASEMNELLLKGKIDLAFIDAYAMDQQLKMTKVYEEELILCCNENYFMLHERDKLDKKFYESLDYVAYLDGAPVIKNWFQKKFKYQKFNPNIVSRSMDVQGIATLIAHGVGVGVLPKHSFEKYEPEDISFVIFGGNSTKVINDISLVYHPVRYENPLIKFMVDYLLMNLGNNTSSQLQ